MTVYHYLQLVLALGVVVVVVARVRRIFGLTKLDPGAFLRSLKRSLRADDAEGVEGLLEGAGDSWAGRVARAALLTDGENLDQPTVDEVLADQRYESSRHLLTLRVAMTLGSISGLLGALIEYLGLPAARHSLLGLVPGLPEERALRAAMISMAIGVGVAIIAGVSLRLLRRRAKQLYADSLEVASALEQDPTQPG